MGDAARMEECMDEDGSMGQDADACMEGQVQAAAETAHHSLSGPYPSIVASAAGTADGDEQLWELLGFRLPLAAPTYAPYTNDTSQTPGASAAAGTSTASAAGPPGVLAPASARPSTSLGRVGLASGQGMAVAGSQQAVAAHHITPAGSDSTSLGSDMHMQGSSAAGQPGTAAAAVPGCRATVRASAASVMAGVSAAATAAGCMQGMYAGHVGAHAPRMQRPSGRQRSAGQAPVPQSATGRAALLHARAAAGNSDNVPEYARYNKLWAYYRRTITSLCQYLIRSPCSRYNGLAYPICIMQLLEAVSRQVKTCPTAAAVHSLRLGRCSTSRCSAWHCCPAGTVQARQCACGQAG